MKILKFKNKQKFKYSKKIIIKDLVLLISVGIHKFEKLKRQRVKFNLEIPPVVFLDEVMYDIEAPDPTTYCPCSGTLFSEIL